MIDGFIKQCEQERLQHSGAIQPHGAMLVLDADYRVKHLSVNLARYLSDAETYGVDQAAHGELRRLALELPAKVGSRQQFEAAIDGPDDPVDVVLSRNAVSDIIVELTLTQPGEYVVRPWFDGIDAPESGGEMYASQQALIEKIFGLTGFDRVMYYRFRDDDDGEVLAEIRQQAVQGSYLGLRFPASDIPQIARALYLLNPWRLIPDVSASAVSLVGRSTDPPDLSHSDLRSVSPIHLLYLKNMGVQASLSFPIVVAGRLWGLIACHHGTPRQVSLAALNTASKEVRAHTLSLTAYFAQHRMQMIDGMTRRFADARHIVHDAGNILDAWPQLGAWLCNEFAADGAQLCVGIQRIGWGEGLETEALEVVDRWFLDARVESVWQSDGVSRDIPAFPNSQVAGVLAVKAKTSGGDDLRVYMCRHEHIHEVHWGGNPDKPIEFHDGKLGIAPRRSFEKWVEKRMGQSRPWNNESRLLGLKLREMLVNLGRNG